MMQSQNESTSDLILTTLTNGCYYHRYHWPIPQGMRVNIAIGALVYASVVTASWKSYERYSSAVSLSQGAKLLPKQSKRLGEKLVILETALVFPEDDVEE
jgi:hypothetical protein